METRSGTAEVIFLVGNTSKKIDGNKLPSNREVLKKRKGSTIRSSATKAIQLVEEFWQKARIPVKRTQKSIEKLEKEKVVLASSESSENSSEDFDAEPIPGTSSNEPPLKRFKRARNQFISTELVAAFDRCKVSDRNAVMLLTATVKALKLDPDEFVINRFSIQRCRQKHVKDNSKKFVNSERNWRCEQDHGTIIFAKVRRVIGPYQEFNREFKRIKDLHWTI
ncbi:hypothetical protein HHI36_022506 [Cryptolaemus montrouzieri]|uniref:Uncharacterized protein n=1 Tax=Cryptolaemus montrouzieri TaxID=559131 RepID=A0ABD2N0R6_9CUCU